MVRLQGRSGPGQQISNRSASSSLEPRIPASTGVNPQTREELRRLQQPGAGMDFFSLMGSGVSGYQEPLPQVDFAFTWRDKQQQGFRFTVNSLRAGLNLQRGRVELAHYRLANSSLLTHAKDQVILPFETETQQAALPEVGGDSLLGVPYYNLMHTSFEGREFIIPYGQFGVGQMVCETSTTDPTLINYLSIAGTPTCIGTAAFAGLLYLVICTDTAGLFLARNLTSSGVSVSRIIPNVIVVTDTAQTPTGSFSNTINIQGNSSSTAQQISFAVPVPVWGGGQSTEAYKPQSFMQSPLPGNPLIVRTSNTFLLMRTDDFSGEGSVIVRNVGLGASQPIGFLSIGGRPPRGYWFETNAGSPIGQPGEDGQRDYRARIASCNAYGADYQVLDLSITRPTGVAKLPERRALAVTDGYRFIIFDGQELDTGLFSGEPPSATYVSYCTGIYQRDGQVFAEINELPKDVDADGIANGRVRRCIRRYDFELGKWSQVSEWVTLTTDGYISWTSGIPLPVVSDGTYGFMSAYGAPDLPFSEVTRNMHNYATPGRWDASFSTRVDPPASIPHMWNHKFEPPAATDPYSLREGNYDFATEGVAETPALIFPAGYEYADKIIDGIEWGGQDTGGTGAVVTVYIGEGGRLDQTNPGPLSAAFKTGLSHASRKISFPANQSSLLFPQIRVKVERGSEARKTMQALPFTVHGHIDLEERDRTGIAKWLGFGRSKG